MAQASDFHALFLGLERAHGWYEKPPGNGTGKLTGRASTRQIPVTDDLWRRHLAGEYGLGIVPVNDEGLCLFGAADIDIYPLDLNRLAAQVEARGLPLVLCRTKSGGAHLYLFLSEPCPAKLVRSKLKQFCASLGYTKYIDDKGVERDIEIFPKQEALTEEDHTGNWINMPYFGGKSTLRYAISANGPVDVDDFIRYAEEYKVHPGDLEGIEPVVPQPRGDLEGAPPCLTILAADGFPEGSRNNALFNMGVYARKRYGEDFARHLEVYNQQYMQTPLPDEELRSTIKSLSKKRYNYKCKDQPICSVCDKKTCVTREFGVGGGGASTADVGVLFGGLTKVLTRPVVWLWELNGVQVEFATAHLTSQKQFQNVVIEALSVFPLTVKENQWRELIQERLANATSIEVPEDATTLGQIIHYLQKFCTSRVKGRALDELLMGRPYSTDGRANFVPSDFLLYLHQNKMFMDERELYMVLRHRELQHHRTALKGKPVSYWSVTAFEEQTADHTVPHEAPKEAM